MTQTPASDLSLRMVAPLADHERAGSDRMATILGWCLGLGFIAAMLAIFAYTRTFGWRPSTDHEIWNQAGGFFGGVLGPTFGFLSLLALLLTVMVQREQLSLSRKQVAESSAELARSHEIQAAAARAMAEQAHYAAISARAVALGAALEAAGNR